MTVADGARHYSLDYKTVENIDKAGLEKLAAELLARPWTRTDGVAMHVERLLIDSGYLPGVCNAVAIKAGPAVLLSKGMGLRAGNKPMAAYTRRPGERHGHNWYIPNVSRSSEPACRRQVPARRLRRQSRCTPKVPIAIGIGRRPSFTPALRRSPATVGR